jgi:hypothetical protein
MSERAKLGLLCPGHELTYIQPLGEARYNG